MMHITTYDMQQQRLDHQARIAACREYHAQLHNWERGYLASLDIMLQREPVLGTVQLGTLHEIQLRVSSSVQTNTWVRA